MCEYRMSNHLHATVNAATSLVLAGETVQPPNPHNDIPTGFLLQTRP